MIKNTQGVFKYLCEPHILPKNLQKLESFETVVVCYCTSLARYSISLELRRKNFHYLGEHLIEPVFQKISIHCEIMKSIIIVVLFFLVQASADIDLNNEGCKVRNVGCDGAMSQTLDIFMGVSQVVAISFNNVISSFTIPNCRSQAPRNAKRSATKIPSAGILRGSGLACIVNFATFSVLATSLTFIAFIAGLDQDLPYAQGPRICHYRPNFSATTQPKLWLYNIANECPINVTGMSVI